MSYCCGCHHHCGGLHHPWHHSAWSDVPPQPHWRYGPSTGERYLRMLEEEQALLARRMRWMEEEIAALRQSARPSEPLSEH